MGTKAQISLLTVVVALMAGAALLFWFDSAADGEIAEGVTIGGVDVGGLDDEAARSQIRANLVAPLDKPVKVETSDGDTYKLKPKEIKVRADVGRMVDDALAESEQGGILGRSWRRLTGGELDYSVRPKIAYSKKAVSGFVDGISAKVDQDPVDASVEPSGSGLDPVRAQTGTKLVAGKLVNKVERALQDPADRSVKAKVEKVKPEITTEQLAAQYPDYLVVDRANFQIKHFKNLELVKSYTIALGQAGYDTPSGLYSIQSKQVDPVWSVPNSDWAGDLAGTTVPGGVPENPLKARWMGIYNGVGVHGTSDTGSLGTNASHGCIRMAIPDVVALYDRVPTGTPIYIS